MFTESEGAIGGDETVTVHTTEDDVSDTSMDGDWGGREGFDDVCREEGVKVGGGWGDVNGSLLDEIDVEMRCERKVIGSEMTDDVDVVGSGVIPSGERKCDVHRYVMGRMNHLSPSTVDIVMVDIDRS